MLMLPDSLEWVLEMLGFQWPTADEDKLLECAQVWRQFAADITEIQVQGVSSAGNVLGENYGDSIEGFRTTWEKFSGGSGYLDDARSAAEMIAFTFEAAAMLVIGMKIAVIAQLIILACEIIAAQAAAPFTLGLSEIGAMGAVAATRMIVRQIIKECAQQLLQAVIETAKEPFVSALQAMVSDVIAQTVNQNFGAQSGYDLGRTANKGVEEGVNAAKNSANTFGESLRDGAGSRAGRGVRDGMDSAAGRSSDGGGDGGGSDAGSSGSDSSSGGRSSSSDSSSTSSSSGAGSDAESRSRSGSGSGSSSDGGGTSSSGANSSTGSGGSGSPGGNRAADGGGAAPASAPAGDGDGSSPSPWADPGQRPTDTTGQDYAPSPFDAPPSRQDGGDTAPAADPSSTPDGGERRSTPGETGENIPGGAEPSRADDDAPRSAPGDGTTTPQSDGPAPGQNPPGDQAPPRTDDSRTTDPTPSNDPSPSTDRSPGPEPGPAPEAHRVDSAPPADSPQAAPDRAEPAPSTPDPSPSPDPVSPTDPTPAADRPTGTHVDPGPGTDPAQPRDDSGSQTGGSRPSMPTAAMPHGGGPDRTHSGSYGPQPGPAHSPDPESEGMALQGSATATAPPPTTTPPADTGPTQHNPSSGTPQNAAPTATPAAPGPVPHQAPQTAQPGPTSRPGPTAPRAERPAPPRDGNVADASRRTPAPPPFDPRLDGPRREAPPRTHDPRLDGPRREAPPRSHDPRLDGPRRDDNDPQAPTRIPPQRDARDQDRPDDATRNPNDTTDRDRTRTDGPPQDQRPGPETDTRETDPARQESVPPQGDPTPDEQDTTPEQTPDQQTDSQQDQPADQQPDQSPGEDLQSIRDDLNTRPGGLLSPAPHDQHALDSAFPRNPDGTPQRFANPFEGWSRLQNDGGLAVWGRSNNCADCSRSFLESWYGNPTVSAPRTPDTNADGSPDRQSPENDSVSNQERWAGAPFTYNGSDIPMAAYQVAKGLYDSGPGSAALIAVSWPGGGGHAFNAVNWNGHIVWVDTQSGVVSNNFPYPRAQGIWSIPLDADRRPISPTQPQASQNQTSQNQQDRTSETDTTRSAETDRRADGTQPNPSTDSTSADARQNTPPTDRTPPDTQPNTPPTDRTPANTNPSRSTGESSSPTGTRTPTATDGTRPDQHTSESPSRTQPRPSTEPRSEDATRDHAAGPATPRPTTVPRTEPGPAQRTPDATQNHRAPTTHPGPGPGPRQSDPARPGPETGRQSDPLTRPDGTRTTATPVDSPQHQPVDRQQAPSPAPEVQQPTPSEPSAVGLHEVRAGVQGRTGGLRPPYAIDQQLLEGAVPRNPDGSPQRFPDPFQQWSSLQNDSGPLIPGRSNNCADCSRSFLETWYGNPQVSAPRTWDTDADGNLDRRSPERNANENIQAWAGTTYQYGGTRDEGYQRIADDLRAAGPGSAAVVLVQWPDGGGHAFNAVNHNGRVVWVDSQSGQVSDQPIHPQATRVWHLAMDADRNPVTPPATPPHQSGAPEQGNPPSAPQAAGNTPVTPDAGPSDTPAPPEQSGTGDDGSSHPRLGPPETDQTTLRDMYPMPDQAELRRTNPVRQLDMDPVYQQLEAWAVTEPPAERSPLAEVLRLTEPTTNPDGSTTRAVLRHDDLVRHLPELADMHPGERGAVVAALGRLSHSFHAAHAVGSSPEGRQYPYAPSDEVGERGTDDKGNPLPKGVGVPYNPSVEAHAKAKWNPESRDDELLREAIKKAFHTSGVAGALRASGDHRPDFSGRNYAVIEVRDPVTDTVSYVVDSSYPADKEVTGAHSETHLLDWIDRLNATRPEDQRYSITSLFTDREPCGRAPGYANCSEELYKRIPGVDIFYATGYRKEAPLIPGAKIPEGSHKAAFARDFAENMARIGRVWVTAMAEGGLRSPGA